VLALPDPSSPACCPGMRTSPCGAPPSQGGPAAGAVAPTGCLRRQLERVGAVGLQLRNRVWSGVLPAAARRRRSADGATARRKTLLRPTALIVSSADRRLLEAMEELGWAVPAITRMPTASFEIKLTSPMPWSHADRPRPLTGYGAGDAEPLAAVSFQALPQSSPQRRPTARDFALTTSTPHKQRSFTTPA